MAMIGIDICTLPKNDQGYVGIVVAVDYFSKLVIANAIEDKTAITVARFLYEEVYTRFGTPEIQINDQGREFLSQLSEVQHKMLRCTSAYHPQANGLVERCNRTIQTALLKVLGEQHDMWPAALHGVVFAFNTAKHKSTGFSPFYVVHGWHARTVTDLIAEGKTEDITEAEEEEATEIEIDIEMEEITRHVVQLQKNREEFENIAAANIKKAQSRQKNDYNKRHAGKKVFSAGDKVLLYNLQRKDRKGGKYLQPYKGPYTILKVFENGTFELQGKIGKPLKQKAHACNLKMFVEKPSAALSGSGEGPTERFLPMTELNQRQLCSKLNLEFKAAVEYG